MYLPAVYRYTCRGVFSASSDERGSAGHCRGIRSSIEHLIDMNPMTREEALKHFTGNDGNLEDDDDDNNNADVGLIEDGRTNPALVYPPAPPASSRNGNGKEDEEDDEDVVGPVRASQVVAAVEAANANNNNPILHETWSAFGSTEVECLQLTDLKNGSTEIVALAPYNAALASTRKIQMEDRRITSTEIGLGPYKMLFVISDDYGHVPQHQQQQQQHDEEEHKVDNENALTTTNNATTDITQQPSQNNSILPAFLPPLTMESARHWMQQGQEFSGRVYDFSLKMVDQMKLQTEWLSRNLQDDFASRAWASGNRIIAEMPRTVSIFGKVFKQFLGTDHDRRGGRDDDDHHHDD